MKLEKTIKSIPDYPKKGILFRDITSLLENKKAFNTTIKRMYKITKKYPIISLRLLSLEVLFLLLSSRI